MADTRNSEVEEGRIRFFIKDHPRHQHLVQHGKPLNALYLQSQAQIDAAHDQLSEQRHTSPKGSRIGIVGYQSSQKKQIIQSPFPRQAFSPALSGYEASSEIDTDFEGNAAIDDEHVGKAQQCEAAHVHKDDNNNLCAQTQVYLSVKQTAFTCKGSTSRAGCKIRSLLSFLRDCFCQPVDATCPCWGTQDDEPEEAFTSESRPLLKDDSIPTGPLQSPSISQNQPGYQSMRKPDCNHVTAVLRDT